MTYGKLKAMNIPDDAEVQINSVWDEDEQILKAVSCDGFYHKKDNKVYLTPDTISI